MAPRFKTGLALGSGAARGLAHIGVLKVLESEGIAIDIITGSSIGAIIGAAYALNPDANELEKRAFDYLDSEAFKKAKFDFITGADKSLDDGEGIFYRFSTFLKKRIFYGLALTKTSFISDETFEKNIGFMVDDKTFSQTKIELGVTAIDIKAGTELLIREGPIRMAVKASSSIPGILPPVCIGESLCVDGGWSREIPIEAAFDMGANYVIGVDVGSELETSKAYDNSLDIVFRSNAIARDILKSMRISRANLIINPKVEKVHWSDFKKMDECIKAGEEATRLLIKKLKRSITLGKWMYRIRRGLLVS
ncbi:patatin-like phospholipase family protein [bacterium]|nr:patatin-like phospholipase family protein [bacterium]